MSALDGTHCLIGPVFQYMCAKERPQCNLQSSSAPLTPVPYCLPRLPQNCEELHDCTQGSLGIVSMFSESSLALNHDSLPADILLDVLYNGQRMRRCCSSPPVATEASRHCLLCLTGPWVFVAACQETDDEEVLQWISRCSSRLWRGPNSKGVWSKMHNGEGAWRPKKVSKAGKGPNRPTKRRATLASGKSPTLCYRQ